MAVQTVVLFIDYNNFYNGARRAFFSPTDAHYHGQIDPLEVARLVCSRPPPGTTRTLIQVRVYTGMPDATREPKTYAAHMKQTAAWRRNGMAVVTHPLRYPGDWPASRAQQKGVDVALAVEYVAMALDCGHDVGIIASTDSDLRPALTQVRQKCGESCLTEVAAWTSPQTNSRLSLPGESVWCHWLDKTDYNQVADQTDYNV